ncbi:ORF6N domain-containing protein [Candidatus Woesearchaeota archaeon]|nr:ORF6N domain-containing protein [Candidatus Woesearchaeota archaeon]
MKTLILNEKNIKNKIYTIRGVQVMLGSDLAELYQIKNKRLNEQVRRNIKRFPKHFMFQLNNLETEYLRTQFATTKINWSKKRFNPYVFTEQGVAMLSGILNSAVAINISIQIMEAFVSMRKFISQNSRLFEKIEYNSKKILENNIKIDKIFNIIEKELPKKQGIFFDGQMFEARTFVCDLIRSAKKNIILIDNYIDDSTLQLFTIIKKDIKITIYTKNISEKIIKDLEIFNKSNNYIEIKKFDKSHDRFLLIDERTYHFGASLKDLGKKWFAFNKLENIDLLNKLT